MARTVDEMIDFFLFEKGEDVLVNSLDEKAVVLDAVEKINEYNEKIIITKEKIKTGDVVDYKIFKYLITSQIDKNENSYCARMKRCDYRIAFNWKGIIKWFDCIIETKTVDIDINRYIKQSANRIRVILRDNEDAGKINIDMRFINTGRAWKIIGIDKSRKGLLGLTCDLDLLNKEVDSLELEIANYYSYIYTLIIGNGDNGKVNIDHIFKINTVLKLNDSQVENPQIIYSSSNPEIASVDSNGLVTGLEAGNCIITAKWAENEDVSETISIDVVDELVQEIYTLELTGNIQPDTEVIYGATKTYTCLKINGQGVQVDAQFDFAIIPGNTPDSTYTFTILNDCQCSIKCNQYFYYITLRATDRLDSNLYIEKTIKLRGII